MCWVMKYDSYGRVNHYFHMMGLIENTILEEGSFDSLFGLCMPLMSMDTYHMILILTYLYYDFADVKFNVGTLRLGFNTLQTPILHLVLK